MRSSKQRSRSKPNRPRTLGNIVNRVFDSSGPEGKVRGTPQQIIEKYQFLARDAQLSNDRVAYENFLQHSEHYTRMLGEANRELQREADERRDGQGGPGPLRPNGADNGQPDDEGYSDSFSDPYRPQPQQRDYQAREQNPRDQGQRDQGQRDQGQRDQGQRDQGQREQGQREHQPRDFQPREPQIRDQTPREPRDQQPRDQQPRDQQPRDQQPRDQQPRDQQIRSQKPREPREPREPFKREHTKPDQQPQPTRPVISSMMPDLSSLGAPPDDADDVSTLVVTPEMQPSEVLAAKAPRRRPAPRKPKADAAGESVESAAADTADRAAENAAENAVEKAAE